MKTALSLMMVLMLLAACTTAVPAQSVEPSVAAEATAEATPEATPEATQAAPQLDTTAYDAAPALRVAALNGPTGMGLVDLMHANEEKQSVNRYSFELAGAPDAIVAQLTSGQIDIAALPINLAATLNNKLGDDALTMIAVNTLGVLSVLERGDSIKTLADLSGKTIYATGQGAMPEYILQHLLAQAGVKDVTVAYIAEHAQLAQMLLAGEADIALLPQPFVTSVTMQAQDVRVALDLTQVWDSQNPDSKLVQGVLVARTAVLAGEGAAAVDAFLAEYAQSVAMVNADPAAAGALVEKYGIMPKAAIAQAAIPGSHIVCLTGDEMKAAAQGTLEVLFAAEPKSVGGALPTDAFFYRPN